MFGYGYLAIDKTLTIELSRPYHNDFYFYQAFQILVFFKRCIVRNLLQHTGPYPAGSLQGGRLSRAAPTQAVESRSKAPVASRGIDTGIS